MGKTIYLVANWKSHKTLAEAEDLVQNLNLSTQNEVVICPPFPYLYSLKIPYSLGAQDVSPFPFGAYTGAVTAEMLAPVCKYVIIGHSERRKYFHETNEEVAQKLRSVLDAKMTPILCIDEPYLESQLAFFETAELKQTIVAYEPLTAIGSGTPDTPEHANEVAARIQRLANTELPVLYGGSVSAASVKQFVEQEKISGVLVGGASLAAESWNQLVDAVN